MPMEKFDPDVGDVLNRPIGSKPGWETPRMLPPTGLGVPFEGHFSGNARYASTWRHRNGAAALTPNLSHQST
jgi:hypothetical protein